MTQENKELLLKDLCSRIPYGVIVNVKGFDYDYNDKLTQIYKGVGCSIQVTNNMPYGIYQVKPYLFPMSSMTDEQNDSWRDAWFPDLMSSTDINYPESEKYLSLSHYKSMDWLYKHHFDVNGLIEKGLALDATGLNIY